MKKKINGVITMPVQAWLVMVLILIFSCKQPYNPPGIINPFLLVVDGMILHGIDSSYIRLTHTRTLSDTGSRNPETGALVTLAGDAGPEYSFTELGEGLYAVASLQLN